MSWQDVSYVIASKTRKAVILTLETPRTPTFLARELNVHLANISRSLAELEEKGVVICLTPRQRVGKIYSLTKKGNDVIAKMKKMEK
ncbi:MAG: helix-turn-helix domain-containing protein [Thaumarchaeota archaeon]|nr:helix-turn-helix domain-containing protein [Nitrososphaerota archaeon]MBI3641543.1 helix-turn-helix domain-containing protein [Nitrososphaerota archaeon]